MIPGIVRSVLSVISEVCEESGRANAVLIVVVVIPGTVMIVLIGSTVSGN